LDTPFLSFAIAFNVRLGRALRALHLVDRNDPLTEIVAKKIVEVSKVIAIQRRFPSLRSRSLDFHKAASVGLVWYW
jgi:hypothetical protein